MKKVYLLFLLIFCQLVYGQVSSVFPGAEGFGSKWNFSLDYEIKIVSNLNDSGNGSLRTAIESTTSHDAKIIVFNGLSGIVTLNSSIMFPKNHQIYLAGQTSENGIFLKASETFQDKVLMQHHQVNGHIVRGMSFGFGAPLDTSSDGSFDNIIISNSTNVIYDHCSFLWSTDENVDIINSNKVTIQNSLIAEGLMYATHPYTTDPNSGAYYNPHSMGGLIYGSSEFSYYNNIFAHNNARNPLIQVGGDKVELVRNLTYNPLTYSMDLADSEYGYSETVYYNIINNYLKPGIHTSTDDGVLLIAVDGKTPQIKVYAEGNINPRRLMSTDDEYDALASKQDLRGTFPENQKITKRNYPLNDKPIITHTQLEANLTSVGGVGTFARNTTERRILNDVINVTGDVINHPNEVGGYPTIASGTVIIDNNNNGIPDVGEVIWGNDTFGYINSIANSSNPKVTANAGSDVSICSGESTTLTASGGSSYLWNTGATTQSITVSPSSASTYTVTASDSKGNSDTDDVVVTINSVTANAGSDKTIEEGNSVILKATGGSSYLWNTGATTQSITVSPTSTRDYTVTATLNGCEDTDSAKVTVNPSTGSVTANAGSDVSICSGESTTLTASGGSSYLWNTGATTQSITVSPSSASTYTVTASDSKGNSDTDDVVVTINSVTANAGSDKTIEEGNSVILKATGGSSYLWNTGATTQSITVSPTSTRDYTVTATLNGCEDTDSAKVTVNPSTGSVTANAGSDVSICSGESTTLTASGGSSYLWNTGATTQSITVSPSSASTYTVTASDSKGNSDTDDVVVTINSVTANAGSDKTIEEGNSVILKATGGSSYLWNTGATTQSITVSPTSTRDYTVTATLNGCEDTDSAKVTVNPSTGSVTANAGSDVSICSGESTTLTASGGSSYLWNTGATTQSITVSPSSASTYTVTASDSKGNSDTDDVVVTINSVTANAGSDKTIEEGNSVILKATGGSSYLWNTGATTQSITVSPTSTRDYAVTATLNGCEDTDSVKVRVNEIDISNPAPINASAGEDMTICLGQSITLTASGGATYVWSTGEVSQDITVNPARTTTYELEATSGGITDTDFVTVTVENCDSIDDEEESFVNEMTVYPNPSSGIIYIDIKNINQDSEIIINDMKGSIMFHDEINFTKSNNFLKEIDISAYKRGIYFVRLYNLKNSIVKKIVHI